MNKGIIELFDAVKCYIVGSGRSPADYYPCYTVEKYKDVTGVVMSVSPSQKELTVKWSNGRSAIVRREYLILVSKAVRDKSNGGDVLKQYQQLSSYSEATFVHDTEPSSSNKTLKLKKPLKLKEVSGTCFASFFTWVEDYKRELGVLPNRLLYKQTHKPLEGDIKEEVKLTNKELQRFFKLCKEYDYLPSYISYSSFKAKQVWLALDRIENSILLYLYINILRAVKESPGVIRCVLYYYDTMGLDWLNSFLLGLVTARSYDYYSFFNLARTNSVLNYREATINLENFQAAKYFLTHDKHKVLEGFWCTNKPASTRTVYNFNSTYYTQSLRTQGKIVRETTSTIGSIIDDLLLAKQKEVK